MFGQPPTDDAILVLRHAGGICCIRRKNDGYMKWLEIDLYENTCIKEER